MKEKISRQLTRFKAGEITEQEFFAFLEHFPYQDLGNVKLDFHRQIRRGLPEVIYGSGKSLQQLEKIVRTFSGHGEEILITRLDPEKFSGLKALFPDLVYHERARIVTFDRQPAVLFPGRIMVLSAGASDEEVAEEAYISALYLGNRVERVYDVGVACLARILDLQERLNDYSVIIVVAGMEGALPSVVAGLTATPIIAVPTSVGYGANFNGLAALLAMLNSCSGGVSVVNIDNGFGAAFQATLINRKIST
jgi:hypothetical protein